MIHDFICILLFILKWIERYSDKLYVRVFKIMDLDLVITYKEVSNCSFVCLLSIMGFNLKTALQIFLKQSHSEAF